MGRKDAEQGTTSATIQNQLQPQPPVLRQHFRFLYNKPQCLPWRSAELRCDTKQCPVMQEGHSGATLEAAAMVKHRTGREQVLRQLFLMSLLGGAMKDWVSWQLSYSSWLWVKGNYCGLMLFGPTYGSSQIKKRMRT